MTCWIILEVGEVDGELVYTPKAEIAKKAVEEIIIKGVQRICHKHKPLTYMPELMIYRTDDIEEDDAEE